MGKRKFTKATKSFGKKDFKIFRPEVKPESFIKNKHVTLDEEIRESNLIINDLASVMSESLEEQEDEFLILAKEKLKPIIEYAFNKKIIIVLVPSWHGSC